LIPVSWITLRQRSFSLRKYQSSSSGGRATMIKAFIDARFLESLGLNDQCCRVVETIDEIK